MDINTVYLAWPVGITVVLSLVFILDIFKEYFEHKHLCVLEDNKIRAYEIKMEYLTNKGFKGEDDHHVEFEP